MNREQRRAAGRRAPEPDGVSCLECGTTERLISPDDPGDGGLRPGDVVICGLCATVHTLEARQDLGLGASEWRPFLRRPVLEELEAIRARPAVAELLAAYELAAMERRLAAAAHKGPKMGKGLKLKTGDRLELEGHGPDYRGPRDLDGPTLL
jgi:hypothetical protein